MSTFYCRVAPSLGSLEATHQEAWGTVEYDPKKDRMEPTVFFGLYDLRDYIALKRHKGTKWVLWAGSDLENLVNGFAFNDGKMKWLSRFTAGLFNGWIFKLLQSALHYVEDEDELEKLREFCPILMPYVVPSFLGLIENFPLSYRWQERPQVYVSGHPSREKEYGFEFIEFIASKVPQCDFHLYGADWKSDLPNVVCHGRVSKERFNKDIRNYHCGLRLNESDGFSEITAKSVLMGQYPITYLEYPLIPNFQHWQHLVVLLKSLVMMKKPNHQARDYYRKVLNRYPWAKPQHAQLY